MIDENKLIEFMKKISEEHPYKISGRPDTYSQYNEAWQDCIDRIESFIENHPKIGEWIPCSERLPEKEGVYLVSRPGYRKWITDIMHFYNGSFTDKYVCAWQPLPAPYEVKSDEQMD